MGEELREPSRFPQFSGSGGLRLSITAIKSPTGPRFLLASGHALTGCKLNVRKRRKEKQRELVCGAKNCKV